MPNQTEYPKFIDVLCAAVFTLWLGVSVCIFIILIFSEHATLMSAIAAVFFLLIGLTIPAFILGGIISLPMWLILKHFNRLNRNIAGVSGALTGALIFLSILMASATGFSVTSIEVTFLLGMTALGAISGWNGYRVAWNGRQRRKNPRT